jgi:hypothetical protein
MSSEEITPRKNRRSNTIPEKQELVVVRNPIESVFFRTYLFIIPGIYLFRAIIQLIYLQTPYALSDHIKIITELALIIALVFANLLFSAIPGFVSQLFGGKNLLPIASENDQGNTPYKSFVSRFDFWLNHQLRILFGAFAAITVLVYYIFRIGGLGTFLANVSFSAAFLDLFLYIFPSVGYGYFVGIVVWKLVITSHFVVSIPDSFNVNVEFGHPDGAGGLLPIGMLSLQMVYVTVVPTLLSAFILLGPILAVIFDLPVPIANPILVFGFSPLILIAGILGSVIGLLPALKFHRVMVGQKTEMIESLNQVSQRIIELKKSLVEMPKSTKQDPEDTLKEIGALEAFYKAHEKINTWPVNKQVLVGIWTTQTILWGQVVALYNLAMRYLS